ncbi:MAG: hypothetical protein R6V19_12515 [Armatimonadota bacterium]
MKEAKRVMRAICPRLTERRSSAGARLFPLAFIITLVLLVVWAGAEPIVILLDGFEDGVGKWRTNDSTIAGTSEVAQLCGIYVTRDTPPRGGGAQAATIDFQPADDAWASVSIPVEGTAWANAGAGALQMWVKGRGEKETVDVIVRAEVPRDNGPPADRRYVQTLNISGDEWSRITLRFFGFKTQDDQVLTPGLLRHIYLLQFVKTGTWDALRFDVDDIRVIPAEKSPDTPDQLPTNEIIIVDFGRDLGRVLGQVGFNLATPLSAVASDRGTLKKISENTAKLAPCVGRITLQDYGTQAESYDLAVVNRNVNWLLDLGVRPMLALDARPKDTPGDINRDRLEDFVRLVELRRGTENRPYYELCIAPDSPSSGAMDRLAQRFNEAALKLREADPTMRLGSPAYLQPGRAEVQRFARSAREPYFISYSIARNIDSDIAPDDLAVLAREGASEDPGEHGYRAIRSALEGAPGLPQLFITDWGIRRSQPPVGPGAEKLAEGRDAAYLATSVLGATRWVDKLLWRRLIDDECGLLNTDGTPRVLYRAACLVHDYAPRGSSMRAMIVYSPDLLLAAVATDRAHNIFVVNWSEEARKIRLRAIGLGRPDAVREHKLDPVNDTAIQHRNLGKNLSQTATFGGPGVTVIEFVGCEREQ